MNIDALLKKDLDHLDQRLQALEITVSRNSEGNFTVCSESEPLFCFVRETEAEIDLVVTDTLTSYIRSFFTSLSEVEVRTVSAPIEPLHIKQQLLKPISKLRPTIARRDEGEKQYALA